MKTLYISDLDGTLLRSDQRISAFAADTLNRLVGEGMLFSYATARSIITARRATEGLNVRIPLILYNGVFVMENETNRILISNVFERSEACGLIGELLENEVFPIVYSLEEGSERFRYLEKKINRPTREFIESRGADPRKTPVSDPEALMQGDIYYVTCIGEQEKLKQLYEKYRDKHRCILHEDVYTRETWFETMAKGASKADAARQLKEYLGCGKIVAFGDGKNDIDLFELADESYAVGNAVDELKAISTGVIGRNDEDGVAKWLAMNFRGESEDGL